MAESADAKNVEKSAAYNALQELVKAGKLSADA